MIDAATLAANLSDLQIRAISAFLPGTVTAEIGAERMGFPRMRRLSGGTVRPYVWWGRLMKQLPPGLVRSEWRLRDQQLLWSLTPLGFDVLQGFLRSRLENAA
jgi:hypothetical protein